MQIHNDVLRSIVSKCILYCCVKQLATLILLSSLICVCYFLTVRTKHATLLKYGMLLCLIIIIIIKSFIHNECKSPSTRALKTYPRTQNAVKNVYIDCNNNWRIHKMSNTNVTVIENGNKCFKSLFLKAESDAQPVISKGSMLGLYRFT